MKMKSKMANAVISGSMIVSACGGGQSTSNISQATPEENKDKNQAEDEKKSVEELEYKMIDGKRVVVDHEKFRELTMNEDGSFDFSKMKVGSDGTWYFPNAYDPDEGAEWCKACRCFHVCDCFHVPNPLEEIKKAAEAKAFDLAVQAKNNGTEDYTDCCIVVTAGLAAWGAANGGGPWGAVAGGAAGAALSRLACRRVFP